jgi:protein SCO1/2
VADRSVRRLLAGLLALVALAVSGCGGSGGGDDPVAGLRASENHGYHGTFLDSAYTVPDVPLTGTDGRPYSLATASAPLKVVFFGYTKCPDICQVVMSTIASSIARLPEADQRKLKVVFVTTDPARDTEQVLRRYLDRFNPAFEGVTGPLDRVDALGKPMGVFIKKGQKLVSGGYEVSHTATVISVHHGRGDLVWTASTSQSDMAADLEKILKADA